MFEKIIIQNSEDEISNVKAISENMIVYNKEKEIQFLNIDTLKTNVIIKTIKGNGTLLFCFSQDKRKLAYVHGNSIIILDTLLQNNNQAKKLNIIDMSSPITAISFDESDRYIFIGTKANIVYQYRYNSDVLLSTYMLFDSFKKRTKGITSIEFNKSLMLVSGNRGDMYAVDIYTKISKKVFLDESTTINDIKFINETTAITGHENGDTRIANVTEFNDYKKLDIPFTKIKQMLFLYNKDYMLVCGDEEYISLINVKTHKNIRLRYLSFEAEVQSMTLSSPYVLIVLLVDNTLVKIYLPSPEELESLILHGAFEQAYDLVQREPQLLHSEAYKKLEKTYQSILDRVASAIPMQHKEFAIQTVAFFKNVAVKKEEVALVLEAFDRYGSFQNLVYEKEYIPAYSLVRRYPILKKTKEYKYMEKIFKEQMSQAQKLLIKGDIEGASLCLNIYLRVKSKNAIVKLFLNHGKEFLPYLEALKNRDITKLQEAIHINKEFSKYIEYLGIDLCLENTEDTNIEYIKELMDNEEFISASELIDELKESLPQNVINELQEQLEDEKKLYQLYNEKNFAACYNMIDACETVQYAKITKILNRYWIKLIIMTERFLILNDLNNLQKILIKYQALESRKHKLYDLTKHIVLQHSVKKREEETIFNSASIMNPFLKTIAQKIMN